VDLVSGRVAVRWIVAVAGGTALLVAGVLVGIAVSVNHQQQPRIAVGPAASSRYEITVKSGGWDYGVPLDTPWYDRAGGEHVGTRASCIPPIGYVPNVHLPWVSYRADGAAQRQVVAVIC
jgi:hypothetical protein